MQKDSQEADGPEIEGIVPWDGIQKGLAEKGGFGEKEEKSGLGGKTLTGTPFDRTNRGKKISLIIGQIRVGSGDIVG